MSPVSNIITVSISCDSTIKNLHCSRYHILIKQAGFEANTAKRRVIILQEDSVILGTLSHGGVVWWPVILKTCDGILV